MSLDNSKTNLCSIVDLFHLTTIRKNLGCKNSIEDSNSLETLRMGILKQDDFAKFFMAYNILSNVQKLEKKRVCNLIQKWNPTDESNFRQFVGKPTNSLMPTLMAIKLLDECPKKEFSELTQNLLDKMISKAVEVQNGTYAIISSKDSFK